MRRSARPVTRLPTRSRTPMRTLQSACLRRWRGHRMGTAVPGLPVVCARPGAPIPAERGAGKYQGGWSQRRKCLDQAIRCLPDLPASLPILGRTPQTSRRFQTESRGPPLEPIRPPLVPTLQQQRTSPDAGEESMSIAARIVRTDLGGWLGLTAPRGGSPGEPRSRARVDGPIAGVCGEPIVAATSAPNPKFAC